MARVVEYFGLPGVGKSYQLLESGYCGAIGAQAAPVSLGMNAEKFVNTICGLFVGRRLYVPLIKATATNWRALRLHTSLRPILVIFERLGRTVRLSRSTEAQQVHIDEGVLQFIWRVFFEKEVNEHNLRLMVRCIESIRRIDLSICYMSCPRGDNIARIVLRGKSAVFDDSVIKGDWTSYGRGRRWMAEMLRTIRRFGMDMVYIRTS